VPLIDIGPGPLDYELVEASATAVARPTLVFLHEGLGSIGLWRGFPDRVRDRLGGPRTLVYSRHGYGQSVVVPPPRSLRYMHDEALDVLPILFERLGVERPLLVGHSDGASIALIYAGAGHPVAGLVLIAPHVIVEDRSIAGIEEARQAFLTTDLPMRLARHHADPDATFWGWNGAWLDPSFREWSIEEYLPSIDCPLLLVQGEADAYGTLRQLDLIQESVRGATRRLVLPGVGHAPHVEQPDDVADVIASFVRTVADDQDGAIRRPRT
jgi:pimeloyl-ACP methyl ester carboxylesterase